MGCDGESWVRARKESQQAAKEARNVDDTVAHRFCSFLHQDLVGSGLAMEQVSCRNPAGYSDGAESEEKLFLSRLGTWLMALVLGRKGGPPKTWWN